MSDHCISIVPKKSSYPNKEAKVKEILEWLVSLDIVMPTLSDCNLGSNYGYALSNGAKGVSAEPEFLPFDLHSNGLEIITERQIFDTGQNGIEELICPNCSSNIANEDWDFFDEWGSGESNNLTAPHAMLQQIFTSLNLHLNGVLAIWDLRFGIGQASQKALLTTLNKS